MTKYLLLSVLLIICVYTIMIQSYTFCIQAETNCNKDSVVAGLTPKLQQTSYTRAYKKLYVRATAYNSRSKVNHKGKKLVNGGVAVPSGTLTDGTQIYIPALGKTLKVDDRMSRKSVNKHKRIAKRKGKDIDLVIDIRHSVPTKQLRSKDLGYCEVWIYE